MADYAFGCWTIVTPPWTENEYLEAFSQQSSDALPECCTASTVRAPLAFPALLGACTPLLGAHTRLPLGAYTPPPWPNVRRQVRCYFPEDFVNCYPWPAELAVRDRTLHKIKCYKRSENQQVVMPPPTLISSLSLLSHQCFHPSSVLSSSASLTSPVPPSHVSSLSSLIYPRLSHLTSFLSPPIAPPTSCLLQEGRDLCVVVGDEGGVYVTGSGFSPTSTSDTDLGLDTVRRHLLPPLFWVLAPLSWVLIPNPPPPCPMCATCRASRGTRSRRSRTRRPTC